jgi:hypothetical protein
MSAKNKTKKKARKKSAPVLDANQIDELRDGKPLDFEKHSSNSIPAQKARANRKATPGPIDEPDPEFSDGVKPRTEAVDKEDIKDEDKIIAPSDAEIELDEAKYTFKPNQSITYANKPWTVKTATKDWVELVDKRGYTQIVDFDDITSFKGNTVMTENEEAIFEAEMIRMQRMLGLEEVGSPKKGDKIQIVRYGSPMNGVVLSDATGSRFESELTMGSGKKQKFNPKTKNFKWDSKAKIWIDDDNSKRTVK